jgi:hypothetical protein
MQKPATLSILILLVAQYIFGIYTTLYVKLEDATGDKWKFAMEQLPLLLHILIGTALIIVSLYLLVAAARSKQKIQIWSNLVGFIGILAAYGFGSDFITSNVESSSFLMALAFIVALVAYGHSYLRLKSSK